MMSRLRDQLEAYLDTLDVTQEVVVDVGGGAWPVCRRVRSWNVKKYVIVDNSQEDPAPPPQTMYERQATRFSGDINLPLTLDVKADLVFCLEMFEYVWNPVEAIRNVYALLRPGGTAIVSFPFVYPRHYPVEQDYLRYTDAAIRKLSSAIGFDPPHIVERLDATGSLLTFYRADGMQMDPGVRHDVTGWIVTMRRPSGGGEGQR